MTRHVLVVGLLAALASVALGADDATQRAALERARQLVDRALEALRSDRAGEAADLLAQARTAAPGEPVVAFDHGFALGAAGRVPEAREAYREALLRGEPAAPAAVAARHNLALSQLEAARAVEALLRAPGALEDAVRAQGAPGGEPLTPATVTMLASQLRAQAIGDGLDNAESAIEVLRDAVRSRPGDADAVRNLVLAQRVRRYLEEEKRRQEEQQSERDQGDQNEGEDQQDQQQDGRGDQGESDEQGEQDEQQPSGGDDSEQQAQDEAGQDGESTDASDASSATKPGEPRDLGREEAERLLDQLLDAAGLKARQVEQIRAARLRRGAVERDW